MRAVSAGRDIGDRNEFAESVVVQAVGGEKVFDGCQYQACHIHCVVLPACTLSPAPVQKYPIFFGLMLLLVSCGGLSRGGVGSCKTGSGGALLASGSVTPGMEGMRGGRERAVAGTAKSPAREVRARPCMT